MEDNDKLGAQEQASVPSEERAPSNAKKKSIFESPLLVTVLSGMILASITYLFDFLHQRADARDQLRKTQSSVMRSFSQDCDWAVSAIANVRYCQQLIGKPALITTVTPGFTKADILERYRYYTREFFEKPTILGSVSEAQGAFHSKEVKDEAQRLYDIAHQLESMQSIYGGQIDTVDQIKGVNEAANKQMLVVVAAMSAELKGE